MQMIWVDLLNHPDDLSIENFRAIASYLRLHRHDHRLNYLLAHGIWKHDKFHEQIFANTPFIAFTPVKGWDYLLQVYKETKPDSFTEKLIRSMFTSAFSVELHLKEYDLVAHRSKYIGNCLFEPALKAYYKENMLRRDDETFHYSPPPKRTRHC